VAEFILAYEMGGELVHKYGSFSPLSGCPQGSEEGPLCWNAFINPLLLNIQFLFDDPNLTYPPVIAFADDCVFLSNDLVTIEAMFSEEEVL